MARDGVKERFFLIPVFLRAVLTLSTIFFTTFVSLGFAQPDLQTLEPNSPQRALFQKTLTELQSVALPEGVGDVVKSLSQPVTFSFGCAQGDPVARVSVSVTTTLKAWDPAAIEAQAWGRGTGEESGAYLWNGAISTRTGAQTSEKKMEFSNALLFDPRALTEPQGPLGELSNQTLLYHELLHGQLLLDAMKRADWRESACKNSSPDLSAADANHGRIPELEQRLAETLAARAPNVFALNVPPQGASRQGEFSVTLDSVTQILGDSRSFSVSFLFDTGSNIQRGETEVALDDGQVVVKGKLVNPARAGFVLLELELGE